MIFKFSFFTTLTFITLSSSYACPREDIYRANNWIIHESIDFQKYLIHYQKIISDGESNESVVLDQFGHMMTDQTIDGRDLLMNVTSWDSLKTDKKIMYGDFAILKKQESQADILEVRWFDGHAKHIVYNNEFLNCVSTIPPYATNGRFQDSWNLS